jgi:acid phosphatase (class A)
MERLRSTIAKTTPERLNQAAADGDNQTPSAFAVAAGVNFSELPATRALLAAVTQETNAVVERGKRYFAQPRPYQIDPSLAHCGKPNVIKAFKGYPSGHAGFGYSTAWVLVRLIPGRAYEILARADDYALSREICGSHFHGDTEASHAIGTFVAERLLADPRLADAVAAARDELAGYLAVN